jgi:uncharacterized protein (DUF58 family)
MTGNGKTLAVVSVVLLMAAFLLGYRELAVFGFAGILALLAAGLWILARPRLVVEREIRPTRVTAGEAATALLTITNASRRRSAPTTAAESVDGSVARVLVPALAAHETYRADYPLPTRRRGVYRAGPLTVRHGDPLQLMAIPERHAAASVLYVHPVVDPVRPPPTSPSIDRDGATSSLAPQGGIAFHHLREYVHGDDRRLVHWRASARTGRLMVRHNTIPAETLMAVVLDTSAAAYEDDDAFEGAVRAVASLCAAVLDAGFPLRFWTTAGEAMTVGEAIHARLALLDLLAAVCRDAADPGLAMLPSFAPGPADEVSLAVVTGRPAPVLLAAVPRVGVRFAAVSLVQFTRRAQEPVHLPGVIALSVWNPAEFAAVWNDRMSS